MAEEKEKPLTREDVIDAIARNGGSAWDLDLSESNFEKDVDLRDLDLSGIILNKAALLSAKFDGSKLKEAKFRDAYLQHATFIKYKDKVTLLRDADLSGASLDETDFKNADLQGAKFGATEESPGTYLFDTDFRGANLFFTQFKDCTFYHTKLEGTRLFAADIYDSDLGDADWGNYKIGEETKKKDFYSAESIYRRLKQWYTNTGRYDLAGEFFFREMTAQRNRIKWWPQPRHRLWSKIVSLICGYGERPLRVIGWAASVVLISALIYFIVGSVWEWSAFWNSLYFSAVSFTALGYGSWLQATNDWIKGIGAFESFIGVFTIALFLITFTRKMRR